MCWRCVGGVLEVCWRCVGGVLEVCWRCVGGVLEVCCIGTLIQDCDLRGHTCDFGCKCSCSTFITTHHCFFFLPFLILSQLFIHRHLLPSHHLYPPFVSIFPFFSPFSPPFPPPLLPYLPPFPFFSSFLPLPPPISTLSSRERWRRQGSLSYSTTASSPVYMNLNRFIIYFY